MKDINYCDDCGDPIPESKGNVFTELPFDVASANETESAIICDKCLNEHGYGVCYVCEKPVELGAGESGTCEKCKNSFHIACEEGYHTEDYGHLCSRCSPS